MSKFVARTGCSSRTSHDGLRYLWTDAFAVCNFLELFARTGDENHRRHATELIEQVHRTLGRYRHDDRRHGWISGLDEETGRRHPTAGGLRIGKPLPERGAREPFDERLEWERDGQYFHYLTKWVHALCRAAFATGEASHARWAMELAGAAFKAFVRRSRTGEVVGVFWKMSIDLSRPLVPAMGRHDASDGLITFRELQHAIARTSRDRTATDLSVAINSLSVLCQHADWSTDDPLGLGGLLFDAGRLCQLMVDDGPGDFRLLEEIIVACGKGFMAFLAGGHLERPRSHRLAFRELGLAIGLRALPIIADTISKRSRSLAQPALDLLLQHESLGMEIAEAWLPHSQQEDESWRVHQDINEVMLATALTPETFLSVGETVAVR